MNRITLALAAALSLAFTPLAAQDYQKGLAAYEAGDYSAALEEWRPLANQGNAVAQVELGGMYRRGEGVPQNNAEAMRWFRLAAQQGDPLHQLILGITFLQGDVTPNDYVEAVMWFRLGACQGHAQSQRFLAFAYQKGQGVPQNNVMAYMWFNIAAANGNEVIVKNRDNLAQEMTQQAIEQAQAMSLERMSSGYQDCGY